MLTYTRNLMLAAMVLAIALSTVSCVLPIVAGFVETPDPTGDGAEAAGYLGMTLPADVQVFPGTVWTTPIAANPSIDPDSGSQISALKYALVEELKYQAILQVNRTRNSAPIHVVDSSRSPLVDVPSDSRLPNSLDSNQDGVAESIPIPDSVWADPSDDSHMIIVDAPTLIAYEFWHFRRESAGHYRAGMMGRWDLHGPGWNAPGPEPCLGCNGATASRAPYIGGLLRYEEVAAGEVRHALQMVVVTTRADEYRTPAVRTDGRNVGTQFIVEGARIQLNPDLNLDSLGLNAPSKVIARALQVYGAYVLDTAAGWAVKAQNLGADGGAWRGTAIDLSSIPIEEYRVLQ
jgi:hypothetical protein